MLFFEMSEDRSSLELRSESAFNGRVSEEEMKSGIDIETESFCLAVETGLPEDTDYDRLRECIRGSLKPVIILVPNQEVKRKFGILFPRSPVMTLLEHKLWIDAGCRIDDLRTRSEGG